ncbi:MAG TPA: ArsA family ATPase [Acidimicrobiales bacterium]|nr:ArsA family ATPase [Acidimicrobiales bacterium]
MRVLLFTGKGGVGKTTVAAATALRCAELGHRTIVVSTDTAHSLGDAFARPLASDALRLCDGLWARQLDATERLEDAWGDVRGFLVDLFDWAGLAAIEAEELAVLPGLEELFALSDIESLAASGAYDVIVVDCAPTADTIRLLSLPEVLSWYMNRVFPLERRLVGAVRPLLKRVTGMPVAGDAVFDAVGRLYDRLGGARRLLSDPARTSVRLVVNPERMVIAEAMRTATYLGLFGYGLDAVVANRLLPATVTDPWFKAWKATHAEHLSSIEEGFAPLPVLTAELACEELVGQALLSDFAATLYGDRDPACVLHEGPTMVVADGGDGRVLSLLLPFVDRDDLEVGRRDDELLVRVGPYRRAVVLPDSLLGRPVAGATINGSWLDVTFGGDG